jgi:hypothetical protein
MPGQIKRRKAPRRVPVVLLLILAFVGMIALAWLYAWYSDYDKDQIDPVVTEAMFEHAPKGTLLRVTLWSGPRIVRIDSAGVDYPQRPIGAMSDAPPSTCAIVSILDAKTGIEDPAYRGGYVTCIEGLAYQIK